MKRFGDLWFAYFSDTKLQWLLFLTQGIVLGMIIFFGNVSQEISVYLLIVHLFLGSCFVIPDFSRYAKRYSYLQKLSQLDDEIDWSEISMEEIDTKIDRLYQLVIEKQITFLHSKEASLQKRQWEYQEYFTMWVHQMKTPLFALELLLRNVEEKQGLSQMRAELLKIKEYSQTALQYIRLENISADLDLRSYDLGKIVKNQLKKYALLFINQKIRLDLQEFHYRVITDEKWLSFVIGQILMNALKYTPSDGKICIYKEEDMLVIEDNGIGIRQEDIPKLFQRGFTGGNGRLQKEASGMGLYMSAQIMKNLGHSIRLQSEVGKGTRVSLHFPESSIYSAERKE